MRLWYHGDSDSLYWSDEWDALSDDVTDDKRFRQLAFERGIATPPVVSPEVTSPKVHTMAEAIVKSYKKWERKPADLYPTPVDAMESLMPLIRKLDIRTVWEPACGDGRLARVLEWHGIQVHATDIREHTGFGHGGLDFLNDDPMEKWGWEIEGKIDAVITNPPFSLAREFIEKALTVAPIVIMLVKQNYYNTIGRYDFFQDQRPQIFLPITWRLAFLPERGKSPLMDCAWAIWAPNLDQDLCAFEPLKRLTYPGYHGPGIKSALASLTEAFDELAETMNACSRSI